MTARGQIANTMLKNLARRGPSTHASVVNNLSLCKCVGRYETMLSSKRNRAAVAMSALRAARRSAAS